MERGVHKKVDRARGGSRESGVRGSETHKKPHKARKARAKEKPRRTRFLSRWFLLVPLACVALLGILLAWYYQPLRIWYRDTRKERVLQEQLRAVDRYNNSLRAEIASLETTEGIQDYARRELNLVEEGDHSIVVMRNGEPLKAPKNTRESLITNIPQTARPFGAWTDFWDLLFTVEK